MEDICMNYWYKKIAICIVLLGLFGIFVSNAIMAEPSLKALLITGQNNHRWDISFPILKEALEKTGLFQVDVIQTPPQGGDFSTFNPEFQKYQVVVLDYNGDLWPEPVQQAFVSYVENGGGVVIYHAANNAFPEWKEFNKIIGLGGWGNRDERWGPYIRWRDGKVVQDNTPGIAGAHGPQHTFQVIIRDRNHPITRGLPPVWLHTKDELYSQLRGPAENLTILATAYADPAQKGTGEHEPILFTVQYGKGRIFQTALGHPQEDVPVALRCAGFITTLQRGAEWCATGKVTQAVPEDFPSPYETRLWEEYRYIPLSELLERIKGFHALDSRATITQINEYLRVMTSDNRPLENCEKEMIKFLLSDATIDAKSYICSKLGEIGSEASVPVLADLLNKPELFDSARYALERIPGEQSIRVLRNALQTTEGKARIGILTSIGLRKDLKSIPTVAMFLKDSDPDTVVAAGAALDRMGKESALSALWTARTQAIEPARLKLTEYTLSCANQILKEKKSSDALDVVRSLSADNTLPSSLRIASIRSLAQFSEEEGAKAIVKSFSDPDPNFVRLAIAACPLIKDKKVLLNVVCKEVAFLPAENQVQFIDLFASQNKKEILPYIVESMSSENVSVREASIRALGMLGGKSEIQILVQKALGEGTEAELAKTSLSTMPGEEVGQEMLNILKKTDVEPALKKLLLPLVADRRVPGSEPVILQSAGDTDLECRIAAIKSLIEQPKTEIFDTVLQLLPNAGSDEERKLFEELILKIVLLNPEETEKRLGSLSAMLDTKPALPVQTVLLRVLARSGNPAGLEKIKSLINANTAPELLNAVLEALNEWSDDTPVPFLLDFARANPQLPQRDKLLETTINLAQKTKLSDDEAIQRMAAVLELNPSESVKKMAIEKIAARKADSSLPLLLTYLRESEDSIKEVIIRCLSNWQNAAPMDAMLELAKTTNNDAIRRQALAGVIQLSGNSPDLSPEKRTNLYNDAINMATTPEVLKGVIGALQNTYYPEALATVVKFLDNDQVRGEAEVATVKLSKMLLGIAPDIVVPALQKVIAQSQMDIIKQEAQQTLEILPKFEDFITAWMVSGPYVNEEINTNMLYEFSFPPEKPEEEAKVVWKPASPGTNPNKPMVVELHKILGGDNRVAYLRTYIWSDTELDANLLIGSDDGVRIWVNRNKVFGKNANRACVPDEDTVPIHLKQGWNHILAKIRQGSGEWEFCARIRNLDGSPFEPKLKVSLFPQ